MKRALRAWNFAVDGEGDAVRYGTHAYNLEELDAYRSQIEADQLVHCLGGAEVTIRNSDGDVPTVELGFDSKGDFWNFVAFMHAPDKKGSPVPYGDLPLRLYLYKSEETVRWRRQRVTPEVGRPLSGSRAVRGPGVG